MYINKGRLCAVEGCTDDAAVRSWCRRCYSSIHLWEKRDANALIDRKIRLQLYAFRMDVVPGSVRRSTKKKGRKNGRK